MAASRFHPGHKREEEIKNDMKVRVLNGGAPAFTVTTDSLPPVREAMLSVCVGSSSCEESALLAGDWKNAFFEGNKGIFW